MNKDERPDVYRWLRKNAPVSEMMQENDGARTYLITRYDDAVRVLSDEQITIDPRELHGATPSTLHKKSIFDTEYHAPAWPPAPEGERVRSRGPPPHKGQI